MTTLSSRIPHPQPFPVYLEIEVGGKCRDELIAELEANHMYVDDHIKSLMRELSFRPGQKKIVKFTKVKVQDLGFVERPTTRQLWTRIKKLGHDLCESYDGQGIRLALKDQSLSNLFWIAMDLYYVGALGGTAIFCIKGLNGGLPELGASVIGPNSVWDLDLEVVFRL